MQTEEGLSVARATGDHARNLLTTGQFICAIDGRNRVTPGRNCQMKYWLLQMSYHGGP